MALSTRFEFVVNADPASGRRLRVELKEWLLAAGVNGRIGPEIVSAVTEAFINAVEHPLERAGAQIAIDGEISGKEVVFHVRDQGRWNETVDPHRGHYGYRLMKAQMDSVEVERGASGTRVTLRRSI